MLTVGTEVLLTRFDDDRKVVGKILQVRARRNGERSYYIWIQEENRGVAVPISTELELA